MRIFNQDKTQELTAPDLTKGWLDLDRTITINHGRDWGYYALVQLYP